MTTDIQAVGTRFTQTQVLFTHSRIFQLLTVVIFVIEKAFNRMFVKSLIKEDSGYLLLEDGTRIPVSRIKKEMVKQALQGR